ncbi:MAG TPA: TRAP transporter small permease [Pseudogracilibacillus sp.]|nr:TRAP transporter small permease [Pseudogracilibacillus sp.]
MAILTSINKFFRNFGMFFSGAAIFLMMLAIVFDVFMRNVFGIPITGTYEVVQYILMPMAIFSALGFVYWVGVLPSLTELLEKAPAGFQKFNKILINLIDLVIFSLLTYYSIIFALSGVTSGNAVPVGGKLLIVWPVYFLVPLGFLTVVLEIILKMFNKEEKGDVES